MQCYSIHHCMLHWGKLNTTLIYCILYFSCNNWAEALYHWKNVSSCDVGPFLCRVRDRGGHCARVCWSVCTVGISRNSNGGHAPMVGPGPCWTLSPHQVPLASGTGVSCWALPCALCLESCGYCPVSLLLASQRTQQDRSNVVWGKYTSAYIEHR